MLPDERTTRSDVSALPGQQLEGLVVAPGRNAAREPVGFLRSQRLNVQLLTDTDSAFEEALLHPPDVIIVDDNIGPAGGIELTQRLKGNGRTHFVPVILWTSADDRSYRLRATAAGADAVFTSSIDTQERRTRLWALLKTRALYKRQERRSQTQGVAMDKHRRWVGAFVHDLQSSLAALQANFEFLSQRVGGRGSAGASRASDAPDPDVEECVLDARVLFTETSRGLRTVLDYERFESGRLVCTRGRLELAPLVNAVADELQRQAQACGKDFTLMGECQGVWVEADGPLLHAAMVNVANHVMRQPVNGSVLMRVEPMKEKIQFTVQGDGDQLSEQDIQTLFLPYSRPLKGAPVGHGVGLALAKAVVEMHDGDLLLAPAPGATDTQGGGQEELTGCAFVFELQRMTAHPVGFDAE